ncbi:MAG: hypothetical protein CNLJKLNK_00001 [Holosporales bacterium]
MILLYFNKSYEVSYKFLFPIFCAAKLFSSTPMDLYDALSYQNIMCTCGKVSEHFKFYNFEALGAFVQGTDSSFQTLVKGLKPYCLFNKSVYLQSLPEDVKSKFLELPNLPNEIKETKENLCVHVFAYAAEAFGKEYDPFFIYLGRSVPEGEIATPLTMADFDYTDSLMRYRQLCSMIKQLPMDSITPEEERFSQLKELATIGIIQAQFNCGFMLDNGKGIPENKAEAFQYFKLAADQGHAKAQFLCGAMLYDGEGILENKAEAFRYFKLAADEGHAKAQYNCGHMLLSGEDIPEDKAEACKYFKLAADQGLKEAQYNYGVALYHGHSTPEDKAEAFLYFKLAADQGVEEAQFNCGFMLDNGEGVEQNKAEAFRYLKLAADQGVEEAQFSCGIMLLNGEGIPENKAEAFRYFKLAADQGHAKAQRKYSN